MPRGFSEIFHRFGSQPHYIRLNSETPRWSLTNRGEKDNLGRGAKLSTSAFVQMPVVLCFFPSLSFGYNTPQLAMNSVVLTRENM